MYQLRASKQAKKDLYKFSKSKRKKIVEKLRQLASGLPQQAEQVDEDRLLWKWEFLEWVVIFRLEHSEDIVIILTVGRRWSRL